MKELGGMSPRTLSETLKELEGIRLIKRESFNQIPPKVEYSLTNDGVELRRASSPCFTGPFLGRRTHSSPAADIPD
jgi:DNA-binding HxlR family transcriptional regulator